MIWIAVGIYTVAAVAFYSLLATTAKEEPGFVMCSVETEDLREAA